MTITDPVAVLLSIFGAIVGLVVVLMFAAGINKRPTTFAVIIGLLLGAAAGGLIYGIIFS